MMKIYLKKIKWPLPLILLGLSLSGCQVVSVKQQALGVTLANERNSILNQKKLSEASLNVLSMSGRESKACLEDPDKCVTQLKDIRQILDEQFLSTASELYLAKALALSESADCKTSRFNRYHSEEEKKAEQVLYHGCLDQQLVMLDKSIRYSYAYLFHTKRQPKDRIFDNRQVQLRDFYNQAIAKLVNLYSVRFNPKELPKQIHVGKSTYHINFEFNKQLESLALEKLTSTYNLNFSGLRTINRRDGFGSEFVAVFPNTDPEPNHQYILNPLNYAYKNGINPNIHKARYLAATLIAQPLKERTIDDILNSPEFALKVYDPYRLDKIRVAGRDYPLAANFSAPYGLWLAENNLGVAAYLSLIDRDQRLTMPHLYMLEPFNPNKKIIVLVHGLASSPEAWIALTNDIMGDPVLREHYQVWQVFYSTNMPILESRYQIYAILKQAFSGLDTKTPASKDAVLIGHSMGGIISRLLVSDADVSKQASQFMSARQQYKVTKHPIIQERLQIQPITNFERAIFLSAPHRGTAYADRWFTLAARKVIRLPGAFLTAVADTLTSDDIAMKDFFNQIDKGLIQNGPSDLSYQSKFMALTKDIQPYSGFSYHSIMGNITNSNDPKVMTDGIVPYESSHLNEAVSEVVIKGGHSIQETPEAVLELRRILREHLVKLDLYQP